MRGTIIKFGLLAVLLAALLQLSEFALLQTTFLKEFLLTVCAISLIAFGIILRNQWISRQSILTDKRITNLEKLKLLNISMREYQVLTKIADGHSNAQIAEELFVSENTIKTHVSNLLSKLGAK